MKPIKLMAGSLLLCMLASCTGQQNGSVDNQSGSELQAPGSLLQSHNPIVNDAAIPTDHLLPWEQLNADGFVDPATARMSSAINENSEFWRGADAFETAGTTSPFGQALNVQSGSAGGFGRSSATYRIPLSGENPATLSTDINLYLRDDGAASEFHIGIANYATGRWEFFGGFTDGRIRLPLSDAATGDYISPLGNAFVSIVAYNGSNFDIVGVSLNQFDPGDLNAPPVPGGLTLTSVAGGLELQWNSVLASDLAGYRIHWSSESFSDPTDAGVRQSTYLEGSTRHVLQGAIGETFVAISALDLSGNESPLSAVLSAQPLSGKPPVLQLTSSSTEGTVDSSIQLAASGADSFDWDLDGDAVFEVTNDVGGQMQADTGQAGIIRPRVRATSGGTAVALGAVSLIISQDLPPVAIITANDTDGVIWYGETEPFSTQLSGSESYDDDSGLEYSWSPLGDGNFGGFGATDSQLADYASAGLYYATLRVRDSAAQEAQASVLIRTRQASGFRGRFINDDPNTGSQISMAMVEGHPAVAYRVIGAAEKDGIVYSRALDPQGLLWDDPVVLQDTPSAGDQPWLTVINGNPAIAFRMLGVNDLYYIRASSSTGQTAADWSNPAVLVDTLNPSRLPCLVEVAGQPAIAYTSSLSLYFVRATANSGNTLADWAKPPLQLEGVAEVQWNIRMAIADGKPAIAWLDTTNNHAMYLRATTSTGANALDWPSSSLNVSGGEFAASRLDMAIINGNPAITFFDGNLLGLKYVRANTADGIMGADWPLALSIEGGHFEGADWHALAEVGGFPAIAYEDVEFNGVTTFRRALTSNGSDWGPAIRVAPDVNNPTDNATNWTKLYELNGLPVVTVYNDTLTRGMFCTLELSD